jgi:hypothetical protein
MILIYSKHKTTLIYMTFFNGWHDIYTELLWYKYIVCKMSDPFFFSKPIIVIRKILFIFIIKICQKYQDFYKKNIKNCFNDIFNANFFFFLLNYEMCLYFKEVLHFTKSNQRGHFIYRKYAPYIISCTHKLKVILSKNINFLSFLLPLKM